MRTQFLLSVWTSVAVALPTIDCRAKTGLTEKDTTAFGLPKAGDRYHACAWPRIAERTKSSAGETKPPTTDASLGEPWIWFKNAKTRLNKVERRSVDVSFGSPWRWPSLKRSEGVDQSFAPERWGVKSDSPNRFEKSDQKDQGNTHPLKRSDGVDQSFAPERWGVKSDSPNKIEKSDQKDQGNTHPLKRSEGVDQSFAPERWGVKSDGSDELEKSGRTDQRNTNQLTRRSRDAAKIARRTTDVSFGMPWGRNSLKRSEGVEREFLMDFWALPIKRDSSDKAEKSDRIHQDSTHQVTRGSQDATESDKNVPALSKSTVDILHTGRGWALHRRSKSTVDILHTGRGWALDRRSVADTVSALPGTIEYTTLRGPPPPPHKCHPKDRGCRSTPN
ncbi:hypothetical protein BT63DRAFT_466275 [Microthyrium microscopicum]|uniref:Uncharacterized protein n=1 Tax=Microthyrium microscopicum TaxID=703497 RepID=A0A6A6UKH5_9PEZI|nr:hypothetical protein BT63DRAFT_466275 [Microthyrium microscopicum]